MYVFLTQKDILKIHPLQPLDMTLKRYIYPQVWLKI